MPRQVDLEFENLQVLFTVQALADLITENVRLDRRIVFLRKERG